MTAPNRRGRRQPALTPTADSPEMQVIAEAALAPTEVQGEEQEVEYQLLYPGATVESSVTLAVDFGDGKTNFIKYGVKDIVQEGEDHPEVYGRLATVTTEGVVSLIDDVQDRLQAYEAELERRRNAR